MPNHNSKEGIRAGMPAGYLDGHTEAHLDAHMTTGPGGRGNHLSRSHEHLSSVKSGSTRMGGGKLGGPGRSTEDEENDV